MTETSEPTVVTLIAVGEAGAAVLMLAVAIEEGVLAKLVLEAKVKVAVPPREIFLKETNARVSVTTQVKSEP